MNIQLLLDSAILDEARQAAGWGWVSGATTNPTLLAKSALSPAETLREISRLLKGQILPADRRDHRSDERGSQAG